MPTQTVCRLLLGHELRRAREQAGKTPQQAAEEIGNRTSKISRMELGHNALSKSDLTLLLRFYGVPEERHEALHAMARNGRERGRWAGEREVFPEWFRTYVDLERDAERIRSTEVEIIPGLLQTEDYMRTIHAVADLDPDDVERGVLARKERQSVFDRENQPDLEFILSESCLRRMIGGPAVMREQLTHLQKLSRKRHVQIQVLPFNAESYSGKLSHRFTMLQIPAPGSASPLEFVYVESYDDARYLDDKNGVAGYVNLWSRLQAAALGPADSRKLIGTVAEQFG
ncbi:helix-turn-helix domain-containing protein [Actinokineospora sp. 24-640]